MPSMNAYSPYETLAFFQSLIQHGTDMAALQLVSATLKQDEYIRDKAISDKRRFSVEALQALFEEIIPRENGKEVLHINGNHDASERSPKRRKISNSPRSFEGLLCEDEETLRSVMDKFYAKYKTEIGEEIKADEEAFAKLQEEINILENQIEESTKPMVTEQSATVKPAGISLEQNNIDRATSSDNAQVLPPHLRASKPVEEAVTESSSNTPRAGANTPLSNEHVETVVGRSPSAAQPPNQGQSQNPPPSTLPRQMPSPSPQRGNYGPIQAQPGSGHLMPPIPGVQQRPHARGQQAGAQGRGSPSQYQGQHGYGPYSQYVPHQWHPHMSPQQFQQHTAYSQASSYYPPPQPTGFAPYPPTAPVQYLPQQQPWRGQPWPLLSASPVTTPVSRPDIRLSLLGSGSATPWKRKHSLQELRSRSPSRPSRPEREIIPPTDREDSPLVTVDASSTKTRQASHRHGHVLGTRFPSSSPSRSQSVGSRTSEGVTESHTGGHYGKKIKAEPPTTPLNVPSSDNDQRSSGRRGRPRSATITSQVGVPKSTMTKRKRASISPSPSAITLPSSRRLNHTYDPSLVTVSKHFARTAQLLLNEITSHKLAGIFAKPLSERDAPGYKDLVLRPQDLKSIKAAVSKGGRAALAAIESLEGDTESTPTQARLSTNPSTIGNGFYLVNKSTELIPPKGIVNSSQLEMELVRMFANAVMFNPLSSSERGFGRGLRLRKNGGDVAVKSDPEDTSEASESESSTGPDEDGIISDAREMFNDVLEAVGKWRELEVERLGQGLDGNGVRHGSLAVPTAMNPEGGRHASISASSNIGDDDTAAAESETASTPVPNTQLGVGRKRRKIAEH